MSGETNQSIAKKKREPIPQSVRFNVFRRDNFTCRYCGRSSPEVVLHCDHAKSVRDGGGNSEDNLVTSCVDCNYGKSSKSVVRNIPAQTPDTPTVGLIGMWGHTFEGDDIEWQFKIIRQISDDVYMCQLYSWMDGGATNCVPIATDKLLKECKLYASCELKHEAYDKHYEQQARKRQQERDRLWPKVRSAI